MITIDYLTAAMFLLTVLAVYACEALIFWLKLRKMRPAQSETYADKLVEHEFKIEQLMMKIQSLQCEFESQVTQIPVEEVTAVSEEQNYALAIKLAQQGADVTQLMAACSLSRAEADLIVAIYRGVYKG
ncbi:DUF2802 domain-containing protein [Chitinibacter fontanus]|uniref:DUF2802 domain-containing protein n=1 Tax=Chitinibacter fontanus TaxID=1737446 RepID=A0A7D5ZAT2_9NEIS|nr:DUF2802 domain-containing protein [Chitinibacter fontanus]QLI80124.1 DUF2802 domain-containing protein [Chitinibacter fontanus]